MSGRDQLIEDIAVAHDAIDATHDVDMVRLSPARLRRILEAASKTIQKYSGPAPSPLHSSSKVQMEARSGSEAYWTTLKQVVVSEESLYAEIRKAFEYGYVTAHEVRLKEILDGIESHVLGSVRNEQADIN